MSASVLEPPSPQLVALLQELHICSPAELLRCGKYVRKLASDLPAFDSVWVDALVQARKLTPFQASILSSDQPQQLRCGESLLTERLGHGTNSETYLARSFANRELHVVKKLFGEELFRGHEFSHGEARKRLEELVDACQGVTHPGLSLPSKMTASPGNIVIQSRYIPGFHLGELLVRRGRYPASVVWEIARQLIESLATLNRRGIIHGEIRLENIRLTEAGQIVLVDAGIRNAIFPEFIPQAQLPPESCDGIAPELIGTGSHSNSASDLYSLGAVLWQLLAGRPPYPTGDSLAKLVAHQTRCMDDIRDWAPETPENLALLIRDLVHPDPLQRPRSAESLLPRFQESSPLGKRRLARFLAKFKAPSAGGPEEELAGKVSLQTWGVLVLCCAIGLGVILSDHDSRINLGEFLADLIQSRPTPSKEVRLADARPNLDSDKISELNSRDISSPDSRIAPTLLSLPDPDQQGIVHLTESGVYSPRNYQAVGPLTIRNESGDLVSISLSGNNQPLSINATEVYLEGLNLEFSSPAHLTPTDLLLKIRSQTLAITDCSFQLSSGSDKNPKSTSTHTTAIAWKGSDSSPGGNVLAIHNSQILGEGSAIRLSGSVHRLELDNVLKTGSGPLCNIASETETSLKVIRLEKVTCRDTSSLVRCRGTWLDRVAVARKILTIELTDSVLSLHPDSGALIEIIGSELPDRWNKSLEIIGENSISATGLHVAIWRRTSQETPEAPPGINDLPLEGLMTGEIHFAGNSMSDPRHSTVLQLEKIPRTSRTLPGYRLGKTDRKASLPQAN